jgi:hypothetical protein
MKLNFDTDPQNLIVGIGPHICQKHYEVKSDVSGYFDNIKSAVVKKGDKLYLCLYRVAKAQLIIEGVKTWNIKIDKRCTFEDKNLPSF